MNNCSCLSYRNPFPSCLWLILNHSVPGCLGHILPKLWILPVMSSLDSAFLLFCTNNRRWIDPPPCDADMHVSKNLNQKGYPEQYYEMQSNPLWHHTKVLLMAMAIAQMDVHFVGFLKIPGNFPGYSYWALINYIVNSDIFTLVWSFLIWIKKRINRS